MRSWMLFLICFVGVATTACTKSEPGVGSDGVAKSFSGPTIPVGVQGIVAIGDVKSFFNGVGKVAATIEPSLTGEGLRNQLGMMVGDVGLEAFSGGVAVLVLGPNEYVLLAPMKTGAGDGYAQMAQSFGLQTKRDSDWFAAGTTPETLDTALGMKASVESHLASCGSKFQIAGRVAELIDPFDSRIQLMMGSLGQFVSESGADTPDLTTKILEVELRAFYSVLKQMESLEINIDLGSTGLTFESNFSAVAGSELAKFLGKNTKPIDNSLFAKIPGGAAVRVGFNLDPKSVTGMLLSEVNAALAVMNYDSKGISESLTWMDSIAEVYGREFVAAMMLPGKELMSVAALWRVDDAEKLFSLFEGMEKDFKDGGPASALNREMGQEVEYEFTRDSRESGGVAVHKVSMVVDSSAAVPPEQAAMVKELFGDFVYEFSSLDSGLVAMSMGSGSVDDLIAGKSDGTALQAVADFGPSGIGYGDFHLDRVLEASIPMVKAAGGDPSMPLEDVAAMFRGASPITFAVFSGGQSGRVSFRFPADLISKLAMAAMSAVPSGEPK